MNVYEKIGCVCDHDPDAPKVTYLTSDGRKFSVTCTVSPTNQALVVEIDTTFEPNDLGMRVWLNDYAMS